MDGILCGWNPFYPCQSIPPPPLANCQTPSLDPSAPLPPGYLFSPPLLPISDACPTSRSASVCPPSRSLLYRCPLPDSEITAPLLELLSFLVDCKRRADRRPLRPPFWSATVASASRRTVGPPGRRQFANGSGAAESPSLPGRATSRRSSAPSRRSWCTPRAG